MHFQTLQSGPRSVITGENRATCCEKGHGGAGGNTGKTRLPESMSLPSDRKVFQSPRSY